MAKIISKKHDGAANLVIVESPAKAKTISKFLGKDWEVRASFGHVRDLPKSKMGIDTEHDFSPTYTVPPDKKKVINELKGLLGDNTALWVATDEDREGEAIGWHLLEALKVDPKKRDVKRIVFHEITKDAILKAIEHPRQIEKDLVDAQQARRVLDRLVGYELSPLLWKKVRYGLSAGRVQSVALRLVVEREAEIAAFNTVEYWSLHAGLEGEEKKPFEAMLSKINGEKAGVSSKDAMDEILRDLDGARYAVASIEEKEVSRNPAAPFTTSTLQQEASRKLHFSVKKTMKVAQDLYEGIEVHGEHAGIITYMRTDSVHLAPEAIASAMAFITKEYGREYALPEARVFKSKKGAQEAHEAIRPVNIFLTPEDFEAHAPSKDHARLYELIWKRMLASQMQQAKLKQMGVDITATGGGGKQISYVFRATGQTILFDGFMKLYLEDRDEGEEDENEETSGRGEKFLPKLRQGEPLDLRELKPEQHFTKPPPRYTDASLIKRLEAEGIGRPSTYAPTITTIETRGYVEREQKQLRPTDVGKLVSEVLTEHFPNIVDYQFTARMEDELDEIAEGKKEWLPIIKEFYWPFHDLIDEKMKTIDKKKLTTEMTDEKCPDCGKLLEIKLGRYGKFKSCTGYPECKFAQPVAEQDSAELKALQEKYKDEMCDKCGKKMDIKRGRYGHFLGCSNYPECKNIKSIVVSTGIHCPKCEEGEFVERRVRKSGRLFWGCNKFPKCKTATWDKPLRQCDECTGGEDSGPNGHGVIVQTKKGGEKCMICGKTYKEDEMEAAAE